MNGRQSNCGGHFVGKFSLWSFLNYESFKGLSVTPFQYTWRTHSIMMLADYYVLCMVLNKSSFQPFLECCNTTYFELVHHQSWESSFYLSIVHLVTDRQTPLLQKWKCSQLFWSNYSEATCYSCVRLERITEHSSWFSFKLLRFSIHFQPTRQSLVYQSAQEPKISSLSWLAQS